MASGLLGRDLDSYVSDCGRVQSMTQSIQMLTGQISRAMGTAKTERDMASCRTMVDDAVKQASECRGWLSRVQEHQQRAQSMSERNNRRMMYQKLSDNLAVTVRVLEDVVRRFTNAERSFAASQLPAEEVSLAHVSREAFRQEAHDDESGPSGSGRDALAQVLRADKNKVLEMVNEDMQCLQRIYTDLANVAESQQSSFDTLESNLADVASDVEQGRKELQYAKYSVDRRFKRQLWLGAGALVSVVLIFGITWS
mmetsp:Transcript_58293/g.138920  ORF Transcript_58293/g.138920 Transcript_58293/m.138920 type:complete len:254 (+) Transcript_58293:75-836(+)